MTDQPTLRELIRRAICEASGFEFDADGLEPDEYGEHADAVLAVLPAPVDRAACDCEAEVHMGVGIYHHPWCATKRGTAPADDLDWKAKLGAVTDGRDHLQRENARLWRDLATAERLRENADFHLGQEMARRQLAEKTAARLRSDRAAVLREAADDLATAFGDPMAKHIGLLGAAHLRRRAREVEAGRPDLRRMADGAQQPEAPRCDVEFEGGGRCGKPAGHRPPGSDDPHVPTPCSIPNPCEDGELCARHEREQAHAEGEHAFCGDECAAEEAQR
ncbi:hypothetical protein [Streptomyces sp. NPDC001205]